MERPWNWTKMMNAKGLDEMHLFWAIIIDFLAKSILVQCVNIGEY